MHLATARKATRRVRDGSSSASPHAALGACAESCEDLLVRLTRDPDGRDPGAEVQLLVGEFRRRLVEYLVSEERDAVLERAAAEAPRLARRVQELRERRGELCDDAHALASGLGGTASGPGWALVHARFQTLRQVLQEHEQAENDVLQCAYLDDIGSGD